MSWLWWYQPTEAAAQLAGAGAAGAPGHGRIKLRSTAAGLGIGSAAANGRIKGRGTAFGSTPPVNAPPAAGRFKARGSASGLGIGIGIGQARFKARGSASGLRTAFGTGHGRLKARGTAFGVTGAVSAPPAAGRLKTRGTATGLRTALATAHGRLKGRGIAIPNQIAFASAKGFIHVRGKAVVFIEGAGLPVADPQAQDIATSGDAFVTVTSGDAILMPVDA